MNQQRQPLIAADDLHVCMYGAQPQLVLLVLLAGLDDEEEGERDDGEGREDAGGDLERGVDAGDAGDVEGGGGRRLAVGHLGARRVRGEGAQVVGARGDVAGDGVLEAAGRRRRVRLLGDLELARLVLADVVLGLAPPAVLLARRRVAQLHLHALVPGVGAGRLRGVQAPRHRQRVHAGVQDCEKHIFYGNRVYFNQLAP
uniref:Uncharacterized protein n=1 Tax=Zea mays TaxID=4577 RepID=A0A804PKM0_MAIZE